MKKILFALPLLFLLTACPIGLDYSPGAIGTEVVNENLSGTWVLDESHDDHEVRKVKFTKIDKYSYAVEVLEQGEMYALETSRLTMYQTKIDGLNVMYLKPEGENKYYLYQFEMKGNKQFSIGDISLLDGGVDAVKSTQNLRDQIQASKNKEAFLALDKFLFNKK